MPVRFIDGSNSRTAARRYGRPEPPAGQELDAFVLHRTADPLVPYSGGRSWASSQLFPNVQAWTANWARRNRCEANPVESVVAPDVTRAEYTNCAEDAAVVLYTVRGGGHSWPGGKPMPKWIAGSTSTSIDATCQMWAFFREHPLPEITWARPPNPRLQRTRLRLPLSRGRLTTQVLTEAS
jgi:poly(3-hydroxybutyrate) depolymerase